MDLAGVLDPCRFPRLLQFVGVPPVQKEKTKVVRIGVLGASQVIIIHYLLDSRFNKFMHVLITFTSCSV